MNTPDYRRFKAYEEALEQIESGYESLREDISDADNFAIWATALARKTLNMFRVPAARRPEEKL